ncbi:MAG: hypothetical protein INR71_14145, partial [Terriglobus roseus]|nr:hypothetical protein [Terriglobus roseus]
YKNSAEYVLERHLRREEAILPGAQPVRQFTTGKGENAKSEPVYRRADVVATKTVESWHKEGRAVNNGEQPLKLVPIRAVTLIRKREVEDAARETGEKPMQGLYSEDQTDWIIPDPIGPDRKIPKNAFGNIDIYVSSMVPAGAAHVRLKGTAKLCKKLGIDFAEAVTGFEFGKQRAVPVVTGVVVAAEHEGAVRDAWREEQERVREREREKRQAACLAMCKKFLSGMRIMERMQDEYGHAAGKDEDEVNPWMNEKARQQKRRALQDARASVTEGAVGPAVSEDSEAAAIDENDNNDELGGGFFPEGRHVDEAPRANAGTAINITLDAYAGGFLVDVEDMVTQGNEESKGNGTHLRTPISLQSVHEKSAGAEARSGDEDVRDTSMNDDVELQPRATKRRSRAKAPGQVANVSSKGRGSKRRANARAASDGSSLSDASETGSNDASSSDSGSSFEQASASKPRRTTGRAIKKDAARVKEAPRNVPGRRATRGVRSRYFDGKGAG